MPKPSAGFALVNTELVAKVCTQNVQSVKVRTWFSHQLVSIRVRVGFGLP